MVRTSFLSTLSIKIAFTMIDTCELVSNFDKNLLPFVVHLDFSLSYQLEIHVRTIPSVDMKLASN